MQIRNLRAWRMTGVTVAAVAAGSLALAACGSSGGGGTGNSSTPPAPKTSSSSSSGGGLGGNNSSGNSGSQTYSIGFEGPLSGDYKALGINELDGAELAVAQANASGNYPFTIKLVQSDDMGDENQAPAAAAALIQDSTIVGVVGPAFSGPTEATGKKYAAASLALISPSATNETLTSSGYTTFHRIVPTDAVEGKATADYLAKKFKGKKIFVIDDTSAYGQGVAEVVRQELKKDKISIQSASIAPTSDYSAIAQQVESSGAAAMYYGGYDAQAGLLAKALVAVHYKGFEISGNGAKSSVFTSTAKSAGNGYYFACGCLDATTAPSAKAFNKAYTAKFKTPPSTYSPEAYDATNAMISAIASAAKAGGVTRASVETAVNNLDYKGITTTVKFTSSGEVAQATVNLYEQIKGKITLLGNIVDQK